MSHLVKVTAERLTELRNSLSDSKNVSQIDDFELNKWLTACEGDVKKAEEKYRNSEAYKIKMGADKLVEKYDAPEVIRRYMPGGQLAVDKEGSVLKIELFGKYDIAGFLKSCTIKELEREKLFQCESIKKHSLEQTKKLGRRVDGVTIIFDMEGTDQSALWLPGIHMYLHLVKVLEDNYPEMLKCLIVVNAPSILPMLWNIGKVLISEDMNKKIIFCGDDYKDILLERISAHQLPAYLGGEMKDPDGNTRCISKLNQGGTVPEEYSIRTDFHPFSTTTIGQGSSYVIDVMVQEAFLIINWQLQVQDKDIGVELLHVTTKGDEELKEKEKMDGWRGRSVKGWMKGKGKDERSVLAYERISPNHYIHDDFFVCWVPGLYRLVLDNSYSWSRRKKVNYRVWISKDPEGFHK